MNSIPHSPRECANLLLSMLPDDDYRKVAQHLEFVPTPLHFVLFERHKPIRYLYFPLSGEHSILATMSDGETVEIGTVGHEGLSTIDLLTGNDIATETTVCQIPGDSLRMSAEAFKELSAAHPSFRALTMRYLQAYLTQVSQSVACNALHSLEQRFARWLLMSHDRVHQNQFQLTHEYLASMLGVHRPSVSLVAAKFQQEGLIEYKRGVVTVLDREGLERAVCECYGVVKKQYQRLLGIEIG